MAALVFESNKQPDYVVWLAHTLVGNFSEIKFPSLLLRESETHARKPSVGCIRVVKGSRI